MTSTAQTQPTDSVRLEIDYAGTDRDRFTTLFRAILAIPILVVFGTLEAGRDTALMIPTAALILFRQKYPRWWFDFSIQYQRFMTRIICYLGLLTDDYPSTDEEQGVHLEIDYPDATQLNRWLPLFKWFLAIPHYVVIAVLVVVMLIVVVLGWFAILFTGSFPRGFHDFIVGVNRWFLRVVAYAFMLTTDDYPPFSLE
ncbi:MAG: DUF4389 domain-containing protein [Dehalococcoidia bacterium]|nr:DUF4389 domain-containing protein [Dehalococcoidia bacterium]